MNEAALTATQRVSACGRLSVEVKAGRTRISTLYQEGAAKIRMPAITGDPLEAVLINMAGGLTGGDRLVWELSAGPRASLMATTQACEKVYRAGNGHAGLSTHLAVAEGARLAWLPQETILFDRSALRRTLDVDLAPGAEVLLLEAAIFGRHAMGERTAQARFSDRWRIRVAGRIVHAEAFAIGPDVAGALPRRAVLAGAAAMATLLLVSPDGEGHLEAARDIIGEHGGVSAWSVGGTGKLLARLVAEDGYALRQRLVPLIRLLNGQAGLPKVWSL